MTDRRIIHVDMDAFYASVEQRYRPELRGRPVAVGRARERGVVAAASYEARRYGVKSAMPSVTAMHRCPDLVFVAPRFDVYRGVSGQIREIFEAYTDLIEPLSLDEAYLDVTEVCAAGATATGIAEDVRARIREVTGLTASAGVSFNKFLAKLASDQDKPDGLTVIRPHRALDYVRSLPVGRFHGVGPVTEEKMRRLGVRTGADLGEFSVEDLRAHFGSSAERYHDIARGVDHRPVEPNRERKSVGAEETFLSDIETFDAAAAELLLISGRVSERAAQKGVVGRTVTLKVKYADFEQVTRRKTLSRPVEAPDDMTSVAAGLLEDLVPFRCPVRLLGVSLSLLEPEAEAFAQPDLFDLS